MTRSNGLSILTVLMLAGVYAYFFTDWFRQKTIQIVPQNRFTVKPGLPVNPVSFSLDGKYAITLIKVFSVASLQTNKLPVPLWHMVASSNSTPIKGFLYGMPIEGMHTASNHPQADELLPNVPYRIFVEAGKAKGHADFLPVPNANAAGL